jgi:hypothetical protein
MSDQPKPDDPIPDPPPAPPVPPVPPVPGQSEQPAA